MSCENTPLPFNPQIVFCVRAPLYLNLVFLEKLTLHQFKNYETLEVDFSEGINCLFGRNGSGKTNLLDAIHYLAFTKSAFAGSDQQNIRTGGDHFVIKGLFRQDGPGEVVCSFQTGRKKSIRENELETPKLSEHIGKYPVVLIAPNDIELIWDGSELRRKFFDSLISQVDRAYLESLIQYSQYLKQRNGLLRIAAERGTLDRDLLETYNQKLAPLGKHVFEVRANFLLTFLPMVEEAYRFLAGGSTEHVSIEYQSDLHAADFPTLLGRNTSRDLQLQRTTTGIHRDEFVFQLEGNDLKRYGSQGQQKSFLIALKLAEFRCLAGCKNKKPILLLDDIFDKLDDERIQKLIQMVAGGTFGQLFITDARSDRSREIFEGVGLKTRAYLVEEGRVSVLSSRNGGV